MATEAKKLQVGGFILTAVLLAVAALIWTGATRLFERTSYMVTYFPESVQGLERGAPVKYRGVPAGRVEDIGIAPDTDLIEVLLSIDREYVPMLMRDPRLRAELQLVGITGLRYVEISPREGDSLVKHPELTFEPPYPVIPSAPSTIMEVAAALDEVYDTLQEVDVAGISRDLKLTLQATRELLTDERLDRTVTNLETTSLAVSLAAEDLQRLAEDDRLLQTVANLEAASRDARTVAASFADGDPARDFNRTLRQLERLASTGESTLSELELAVERFGVVAGEVEGVAGSVRDQPSLLLLSKPAEPREPGRGRAP